MSKKVKGLIEKELTSRLQGVNEFVVVSVRGINGVDNNQMRHELCDKAIHLHVVNNSLAQRALGDMGVTGLASLFVGSTAIAYGGSDIVDVAKTIAQWGKKLEPLQIKGGYLDGQMLDAAVANELANMPSRAELQGAVVNLAKSPGARLAGAIAGPASYIAGCIKTLADKEEAA